MAELGAKAHAATIGDAATFGEVVVMPIAGDDGEAKAVVAQLMAEASRPWIPDSRGSAAP